MIIACEQCNKKFEIESRLIPNEGRLLKCGSCEHVWFYVNEVNEKLEDISVKDSSKKKEFKYEKQQLKEIEHIIDKKKSIKTKKISFLNIILVFIISFVALILLLETFKYPIIKVIPNIEILLISLHEIVKDIILFTKDLIN